MSPFPQKTERDWDPMGPPTPLALGPKCQGGKGAQEPRGSKCQGGKGGRMPPYGRTRGSVALGLVVPSATKVPLFVPSLLGIKTRFGAIVEKTT